LPFPYASGKASGRIIFPKKDQMSIKFCKTKNMIMDDGGSDSTADEYNRLTSEYNRGFSKF
jgi:hypothetical protein